MTALPSAFACHASRPARRLWPLDWTAKSTIEVVPPKAAARVPVSNVSLAKVPPNGSSMWVWTSMAPGITYFPAASIVSSAVTPAAARSVPIWAIVSPSTRTSARYEPSAVTIVPLAIRVRMGSSSRSESAGLDRRGDARRDRHRSGARDAGASRRPRGAARASADADVALTPSASASPELQRPTANAAPTAADQAREECDAGHDRPLAVFAARGGAIDLPVRVTAIVARHRRPRLPRADPECDAVGPPLRA